MQMSKSLMVIIRECLGIEFEISRPFGTRKRENISPLAAIVPAWVENYQALSKLCDAYVKIMSDETDGFFNINNLVHLFFGIEHYHKVKRSPTHGSLAKALEFTISRIGKYFHSVETFATVADSIDLSSLSHARQVLVHANEGEPDYPVVFHQLIFITRCTLLMEMNYPVANVEQDTNHWSLWHFFAERRKADESNN